MKWLYKISNTINDKLYIGITIDPDRRWKQHSTFNTNCQAIKNAMRKHGVENFNFELLCCGEDDYIEDLEIKAIHAYNSQSPDGYNITIGGEGGTYYKWDSQWDKLLGTKPDADLGEELGVGVYVVSRHRKNLGIQSYGESVRIVWEPYLCLLGTMPDNELSELSGISSSSIWYKRKKLGIPPYKKEYNYEVPDELIKLLGKKGDPYLSEKYNIPQFYIRKLREERGISGATFGSWVAERNWSDVEISTIKDTSLTTEDLAEVLNLSRTTVQKKRKELGIKFDRKYKKQRIPVTDEMKEDFIKRDMTSTDIAKKYNISWSAADRKRKKYLSGLEETQSEL